MVPNAFVSNMFIFHDDMTWTLNADNLDALILYGKGATHMGMEHKGKGGNYCQGIQIVACRNQAFS